MIQRESYLVFKVILHLFVTHLLKENLTIHFSNATWWFRDGLKKEAQTAKCPWIKGRECSQIWGTCNLKWTTHDNDEDDGGNDQVSNGDDENGGDDDGDDDDNDNNS